MIRTHTSVNDEYISKVFLGCGIVASKVDHTAANTGGTVAATTFDPITRDVLLLPLGSVYMYKYIKQQLNKCIIHM